MAISFKTFFSSLTKGLSKKCTGSGLLILVFLIAQALGSGIVYRTLEYSKERERLEINAHILHKAGFFKDSLSSLLDVTSAKLDTLSAAISHHAMHEVDRLDLHYLMKDNLSHFFGSMHGFYVYDKEGVLIANTYEKIPEALANISNVPFFNLAKSGAPTQLYGLADKSFVKSQGTYGFITRINSGSMFDGILLSFSDKSLFGSICHRGGSYNNYILDNTDKIVMECSGHAANPEHTGEPFKKAHDGLYESFDLTSDKLQEFDNFLIYVSTLPSPYNLKVVTVIYKADAYASLDNLIIQNHVLLLTLLASNILCTLMFITVVYKGCTSKDSSRCASK